MSKHHRYGYTREEAVTTLRDYLRKHQLSQMAFLVWLSTQHGIQITPQYLSDMLSGNRAPGPKFCEAFRAITGKRLVAGLVEEV